MGGREGGKEEGRKDVFSTPDSSRAGWDSQEAGDEPALKKPALLNIHCVPTQFI